jgi:hypothetical protein
MTGKYRVHVDLVGHKSFIYVRNIFVFSGVVGALVDLQEYAHFLQKNLFSL